MTNLAAVERHIRELSERPFAPQPRGTLKEFVRMTGEERNQLCADLESLVRAVRGFRSGCVYGHGGGIMKCALCGGSNIRRRYRDRETILATDPIDHDSECVLATCGITDEPESER